MKKKQMEQHKLGIAQMSVFQTQEIRKIWQQHLSSSWEEEKQK